MSIPASRSGPAPKLNPRPSGRVNQCPAPPSAGPAPPSSLRCLPPGGALPLPRLRRPRGARCRPLRRSLPRRPGASLPPRRGDSRSGRRRLRRPLPLLLLLLPPPPPPPPPRLLRLSAPRTGRRAPRPGPAAPASRPGRAAQGGTFLFLPSYSLP
ncbi:uncharacterized protein LOC120890619 isoform X1 [Ictidomys tridecemlineatus]